MRLNVEHKKRKTLDPKPRRIAEKLTNVTNQMVGKGECYVLFCNAFSKRIKNDTSLFFVSMWTFSEEDLKDLAKTARSHVSHKIHDIDEDFDIVYFQEDDKMKPKKFRYG